MRGRKLSVRCAVIFALAATRIKKESPNEGTETILLLFVNKFPTSQHKKRIPE